MSHIVHQHRMARVWQKVRVIRRIKLTDNYYLILLPDCAACSSVSSLLFMDSCLL